MVVSQIESFTNENLYAANTKDNIEVENGCKKIKGTKLLPGYSWNIVEYKEK